MKRAYFNNNRVFLKTITWTRDSHGLFDYESHHITRKNVRASGNSTLSRVNNEIQIKQETDPIEVTGNDNVDFQNLLCLKTTNGRIPICLILIQENSL